MKLGCKEVCGTAVAATSRLSWNLRVSPDDQALIDRAVRASGLTRTDFVLQAARTAALTIPAVTPDATTLSLAIEATKLAGQPIRHLLGMAMPRVPANPQLQVELLRLALEDAPNHADRFVSEAMKSAREPHPGRSRLHGSRTTR